jgi:hypothetical protein
MNPTGRLFFYSVGFETIPDEPDGRAIFMAHATGPCLIGWGCGVIGDQTPDAYMLEGKGFVMNFGNMLYHSLYYTEGIPELRNYLIWDNEVDVLWKVNTKTLMNINWQHEEIKHNLQVIITPLKETMNFLTTDRKAYGIGFHRADNPANHELNCMEFTGFYKNGSKTESISGFALLLAIREENLSSPAFPIPLIDVILFTKEEGEYEPLITAVWTKNGWDINGTTFPEAKTFNVNYWTMLAHSLPGF